MNTCVAVSRSIEMMNLLAAGRGEVGEMCWKWDLSLFPKSEGLGREVVGDVVKNSPGKRRLVPYTSSATVELMSCLSAASSDSKEN